MKDIIKRTKILFTEETISIVFGIVLIIILLVSAYSFFSNRRNSPQITLEAASTQSAELTQNGPYEPVQTYTVLEGESLSSIAKKLYGDIVYWPLISMENRIEDVNTIRAGEVLDLPGRDVLLDFTKKVKPGQILTGVSIEALTDKTYQVKKGDTLWHICERRYGDPRKYVDIAKINKIQNPNYIEVDWQLTLPDL